MCLGFSPSYGFRVAKARDCLLVVFQTILTLADILINLLSRGFRGLFTLRRYVNNEHKAKGMG